MGQARGRQRGPCLNQCAPVPPALVCDIEHPEKCTGGKRLLETNDVTPFSDSTATFFTGVLLRTYESVCVRVCV